MDIVKGKPDECQVENPNEMEYIGNTPGARQPFLPFQPAWSPGHMPQELPDLLHAIAGGTAGYQQSMARCLFSNASLGEVPNLLEKKHLPARFFNNFQKAMELFDESTRLTLKQLRREGFSVQCRPDCSHCCFQMPTGVSTGELLYLYYGLQQTPMFSRCIRRCLEAEEVWEESRRCLEAQEASGLNPGESVAVVSKYYSERERPCPFLAAGRCVVYAFRPLACRMHFSLTPPHWCRPSHFQNQHALRINLQPGERVFDALESIDERLPFRLSDVMICGILELTVNWMHFEPIRLIRSHQAEA